jgi:hypothetical protein
MYIHTQDVLEIIVSTFWCCAGAQTERKHAHEHGACRACITEKHKVTSAMNKNWIIYLL